MNQSEIKLMMRKHKKVELALLLNEALNMLYWSAIDGETPMEDYDDLMKRVYGEDVFDDG